MGKIGSGDCGTFYAGGYNLLGFSTTLSWTVESGLEEAHVLGDKWVYYDNTKLSRCNLQQNGFFTLDGTAGGSAGSNTAFKTMMDNKVRVGGFFGLGGGGLVGAAVKCFEGMLLGTFEIQAERGALAKANGSFVSTGFCKDGILLLQDNDIGTGGDGSTYDSNVVSTNNGGTGFLQVVNYDPDSGTGLEVKIQHTDQAETVWVDLLTFTVVTADYSFEVKAVTGNVNEKWKVVTTWQGTPGGNETAEVAVAFVRNPSTV